MLNELESLSGNIGRLIQISERHKQAHQALQDQLEQLRADYANVQAELAQVRLNSILEKLPRATGAHHAESDNQLDLLEADSREAHEAELHGEHHQGEKA